MVIQAIVAFVIAEVIGKIAGKFHLNYQPFAVLPDVNKLVDHAVDNSFPSDHTILFFQFVFRFGLFVKNWMVMAYTCTLCSDLTYLGRGSLSF